MPLRTDAPPKYFLCESCAKANNPPLVRYGDALREGMHCPRCKGEDPSYYVLKADSDDDEVVEQ